MTCSAQLFQLSVMSTVGIGVQNVCSPGTLKEEKGRRREGERKEKGRRRLCCLLLIYPVAGILNDLWGPRVTNAMGSFFTFVGKKELALVPPRFLLFVNPLITVLNFHSFLSLYYVLLFLSVSCYLYSMIIGSGRVLVAIVFLSEL
jgi:hypothetical protein